MKKDIQLFKNLILILIIILMESFVQRNVWASEVSAPYYYEEAVDEKLSFHADVVPSVGLTEENKEIIVTYMNFGEYDFDLAINELFSNMGNLTKREMPELEDFMCKEAYNEQDESIFVGYNRLSMHKKPWDKVKCSLRLSQKDLEYNENCYKERKDFSFASAEECWTALQEKLRKTGMKSAMELRPVYYYLDYTTMEEQYDYTLDIVGSERSWDEDDNGYYISAAYYLGDNPVCRNYYWGTGIEGEADSANIQAFIDKNGIEYLEAESIICETSESGNTWKPLPFDDIIKAIKTRFSLAITDNTVDISKIRFSYMTEGIDNDTYRLVPVWLCNYTQTNSDGYTRVCQIIIDAATGEEVIYELS